MTRSHKDTEHHRSVGICIVLVLSLAIARLDVSSARAGSGTVNNNGTIDVTVNLRFPPSTGDLTTVQNQITGASQVLWDASEGQLRFGTVTFACGAVNEDLADMWIFPDPGRAGTSFRCDGTLLGVSGAHVTQFLPSSSATVMAHEFGHLALGLGDEYSEQSRFGACWGFGPCAEAANLTEQNHCLMQQPGGFTQTEFCTAGGHDTVMGEGLPCTAGAAPCTDNCQFFNPTTSRYETTQQTAVCGGDCWTSLVNNFSFLTAPTGLPAAAAPAGFTNPTFVNNCQATDTVLLVLDRSGSMSWNTERDDGEVCGNGTDDDQDGTVDETDDCTQTRLAFVKASARAWLALANGQGVRAGVISFNQLPALDAAFQDVNATNITTLNAAVDAMAAGGNTAIGRALSSSSLLFGGQTGALNRTAFLISDGVNTEGETPQSVVPSLRAQGIRVFSISTGGASDDSTLGEISGTTGGTLVDSRDARTLVAAFVQQWARYRNGGIAIPRLPYSLNQKPHVAEQVDEPERRDLLYWQGREETRVPPERAPATNTFFVRFEEGTKLASIVLAGDLADMAQFGVEAVLDGPSGPGPTHFDSTVPAPELRVVRDGFFVLLEIRSPNPGDWKVRVQGRPGAGQLQSGHLTIITDNPRADLFTSVDRVVVRDPSKPVTVQATPIYDTTLRRIDLLTAVVKRPDGTLDPLALESDFARGGSGDYVGQLTNMPFVGLYEIRLAMKTGPNTFNDPGEAIFSSEPPNTVPVPPLERAAVEYVYVTKGRHVCPTGNADDCDGDDCNEKDQEIDSDRDGLPDAFDHDSDNDEVSDARECRDPRQDPDGDGLPNPVDPDSDGDGTIDGQDPTRVGVPGDRERGPCCNTSWTIGLLLLALVLVAISWSLRRFPLLGLAIVAIAITIWIVLRCCC
jgi:hypothetical protein